MTEPAQLRFKIDPDLHGEFKAQCSRTGVSMADQTARMIAEYLKGAAPANAIKTVATNTPVAAEAEGNSGQEPETEITLESRIDDLFELVEETATQDNIAWLKRELVDEIRTRHDELKRTNTRTESWVEASIEASHRTWRSALVESRRDYYWLGGAALAGANVLGLLLVLISGTWAGREIAVKLAGGESAWHAALLIAGDGSSLQSNLISATTALIKGETFREQYGACVDRAHRAKRPFVCKLDMSPLGYEN